MICALTVPCDGELNTEPLTNPLGKIALISPLVTVPTVVMFPCVKCSFELYPVTEVNETCEEPLITPSSFIFSFTPLTKWAEPVSNVILLLTSIVPPPVKPLPLPKVIDEWSICSFDTKPVVSSWDIWADDEITSSPSVFKYLESNVLVNWPEPLITFSAFNFVFTLVSV